MGLAGMLALGACGGGDGGGGGSTTLDPNEAATVGGAAASQISAMTSGLVNFSSSTGSLGGGFFAPASASGKIVDRVMQGLPSLATRQAFAKVRMDPNCTPAVDDETDSDSDGVPDDATYTFNCSYTDPNDGSSFTVTGTIGLLDSQDIATGFGFGISFNSFRFQFTFPGQNGNTVTDVTINGLYNADIVASGAGAAQDLTFVFRLNGQRVYFSSWDWAIDFTPTGTIDFAAEDMPAGQFDISGAFVFQGDAGQDSGDWAFSLNTTSPLVYDGSCALEPPFSSGTIEGAIVANTSVGFTINYTGCGQAETIAAFDDNT
jgi:hypothetical protein